MAPTRVLPLFPLSTVLFPGTALPLHIFEDRYKLMIRRCYESDGLLGIVSIREGEEVGATAVPNEVGTVARISRIEALSEGKLNLTVVGERRFRITKIMRNEPYQQAQIEVLEENLPSVSTELIPRIRHLYVEYMQLLRCLSQRNERTVRVPEGALELSYAVASHVQVTLDEQQRLLEAGSDERLRREFVILRRELTLLPRLGAVSGRRTRSSQEVSLN